MARGLPSMTALLGVLAIAGYQHRDKLGELLRGAGGGGRGAPGEAGRAGGAQAGTGDEGGIGGLLSGGLGELVDRFRSSGHGETAESWVRQGPNRDVSSDELERALGPETLDEISQRTGLSRQEIVSRLTRELPGAVDRYTPDGRLPDA